MKSAITSGSAARSQTAGQGCSMARSRSAGQLYPLAVAVVEAVPAEPATASAVRSGADHRQSPLPAVAPHTTSAIRPVAGHKARPDSLAENFITPGPGAGGRFSQAWKPGRETPNAMHSHATGQMVRCFAMKTNFMSLPSRRRLRPFLGFPVRP